MNACGARVPTLWGSRRVGFFLLLLWTTGWAGVGGTVLTVESPGFVQRCGFPEWLKRGGPQGVQSERPELPLFLETSDGAFRVHYTLTGPDAVPAADADGNGVPDYVDTLVVLLQYVRSVLCDSLGYPAPPADAGAGGSDAYDVYVLELGRQGLYGETVPERLLPRGVFPRFTSFLKLDNDYSPLDSFGGRPTYRETGVRGLRIAIAHELYHAIQFGNYGIAWRGTLLYELASTFMEWRIFPDTRDYEQFLPELFGEPQRCVFGYSENAALGYRFALFGQYLYLRWGDGILRQMWEGIGEGRHPYAALDTALMEQAQSSLRQAWCEFLPWLYYTGARALPGYFPRAADFPMVRFALEEYFSPPTVMSSGQLQPFEFRFLRVLFAGGQQTPDTLAVALTVPDLDAVLAAQLRATAYTFACGSVPDGEPIPGTAYSIRLQGERDLCRQLFWNNGFPLVVVGGVYPQPFVPGRDGRLCLPVPGSTPLEVPAEVVVYTPAFEQVESVIARVQADGDRLAVCFVPMLRPGVYVYRLAVAGQERWGKFLVQAEP